MTPEMGATKGTNNPVIISKPPASGKKVINIYVKNGKLVIEYES